MVQLLLLIGCSQAHVPDYIQHGLDPALELRMHSFMDLRRHSAFLMSAKCRFSADNDLLCLSLISKEKLT